MRTPRVFADDARGWQCPFASEFGNESLGLLFLSDLVQEDDLWTTMEVGCGTGLGGGRDIFKAHLPSGGRTACSSWKRLHHPLTPSWPPLLAECTKPQIVALTLHLLENFPCKIGSLILDPLFSPSVCEHSPSQPPLIPGTVLGIQVPQ